jgi:hypothetical protein
MRSAEDTDDAIRGFARTRSSHSCMVGRSTSRRASSRAPLVGTTVSRTLPL